MLTCFDISTMVKTTDELKLLTGRVNNVKNNFFHLKKAKT